MNNNTNELTTSYRTLRKTMQNSTSITLPHYMIDKLNWRRQDNIKVQLQGNTLILTRASLGPCHDDNKQEQQS